MILSDNVENAKTEFWKNMGIIYLVIALMNSVFLQ